MTQVKNPQIKIEQESEKAGLPHFESMGPTSRLSESEEKKE